MSTLPMSRQNGLSLVELMVSITIGLILLAGLLQIFLGSKQSYRVNENIARVQESGRFATEFIAYRVRMAGLMGCANNGKNANTLSNSMGFDFSGGIKGYDGDQDIAVKAFGTAAGARVAGTDAVEISGAIGAPLGVIMHNAVAASFQLAGRCLPSGTIGIVCDSEQSTVFQITNANCSTVTAVHNTGTGSPGNCSKGLGYPTECTANGTPYTYGSNAVLQEFGAEIYYIGVSTSGTGRSLYRVSLGINTGSVTAAPTTEELVSDVEDMQIVYGVDLNGDRLPNQYISASSVVDWADVVTARVALLVAGPDNGVTATAQSLEYNGTTYTAADRRLRKAFTTTIGIRNRLP